MSAPSRGGQRSPSAAYGQMGFTVRGSLEVGVLGLDPAVVHRPETPAGSMEESGLFYNRRTQGCSALQGILHFLAFRNHNL